MSGSLSSLSSLFSTGSNLLDILYGGGGKSSTQDPIQALRSAERNKAQDLKVTAADPEVKHTIAAFTKAVKEAKSVAQLLANPTVMKVLLTANGMKDQIGYTALVSKVLTSKLNDPKSLVNKLTDPRWRTLAQTYDFAANGLSAIQNPRVLDAVTKGYVQDTWQNNEDSVTPGLSNALTFKAQASTIKSIDQLLGNPAIRTVVTVALGIPRQIAFQPLSTQEEVIATHLDLKQLQDPKFVDSFAQRYLIAASTDPSSAPAASPDLTTLAVKGRGILA